MTNFGILDLQANNINIELGGVTIGKIKVPSDYVPRSFAPVLGTHHLITGDKLTNGLIVLLEDTLVRRDVSSDLSNLSEYELDRLNETARWALVTDLKVRDRGPDGPLVSFTAIYADGTMRDRTYAGSYKWAVLKEFQMLPVCDSCGEVHEPEGTTPDLETMTRRVTSELLGEQMSFQDFSDRLEKDPEFIDEILDGLDKTIGKMFGGFLGILPDDEQSISGNPAEIPADRPQRPGETYDEYVDRLRDEDEIAGEYDASEKARLKQVTANDEALAALRRTLSDEQGEIPIQRY